ncbi:MAG: homing endonuclease associated repeat-containing protein [Faecousia sp.]
MPTPNRNVIYDAAIRRMTAQALEEAECLFAQTHAEDSEEQLAGYLRECAASLGHTPWPREILGGVTIQLRFGTWEKALEQAGLPLPEKQDSPGKYARVREETERQKVIYRQKKAQKRQQAVQRRKLQEEKRSKHHPSGIT